MSFANQCMRLVNKTKSINRFPVTPQIPAMLYKVMVAAGAIPYDARLSFM